MIDVLVGDKHRVQVINRDARCGQPSQYFVAAAGVDQQGLPVILHRKAGVVASGRNRVARSKYCEFHPYAPKIHKIKITAMIKIKQKNTAP